MFFKYEDKIVRARCILLLAPFLLFCVFVVCIVPIFAFYGESVYTNVSAGEKIFIIDAGHGGEDCGAIGCNGVYEKNLNFEIAQALGEELSDLGYAVIYTRTEDKLLYSEAENIKGLRKIYDLKNRVKIAEDYPNAIFISVHMNSFSDARYSGLQVFYSENNEESYRIATSVQSQVKETLQPNNNRSVRVGEGLYLMENLTCPAILIECGFISNTEECEKLCEKEYQKRLCFSILCGIIEKNS